MVLLILFWQKCGKSMRHVTDKRHGANLVNFKDNNQKADNSRDLEQNLQ